MAKSPPSSVMTGQDEGTLFFVLFLIREEGFDNKHPCYHPIGYKVLPPENLFFNQTDFIQSDVGKSRANEDGQGTRKSSPAVF